MTLTRRSFLRQSAAASIFLGFPRLVLGGDQSRAVETVLEKARARMKRDRMFGLAILVPQEPQDRAALGRALEAIVGSRDYGVQELLLEAVYFCVPPLLVDGRPTETVVLFDPDFRRLAGADLDLRTVASRDPRKPSTAEPGLPVRLVDGIRELLHGNGRLEARAKASTTPELKAAIRTIEESASADPETFRKADLYLSTNFDRCIAAVVAARMTAEKNGKPAFLYSLVRQRFALRLSVTGESDLPYGVAWRTEPRPDPCPACGMAIVPPLTRKFIRFLVE